MRERPIHYLWLTVGFGLWTTALGLIYSFQALGCAYDWPQLILRGTIAATLVAHLVLLWVLIRRWRRYEGFLRTLTLWLLVAALVATAFTYAPILLLSACLP